MPKITFTKASVAQAVCPVGQAKADFFDTDYKGLMLEVRPTGRKVFYLRFTDQRGRQRQYRIGLASDLSLDLARKEAQKLRTRIALGEDPFEAKRELAQIPTMTDFIQRRYLPFVQGYKKSWACDRGLLKNHIEPVWGRRFMDQVTKADVVALMADHRKTHAPASCNRLLILLRYLFSLAKKWEVSGVKGNPTDGIPLMRENNKKERFLTAEEAERLFAQVKQSDNPMLQFIVPMLILTGARKREVLDARWEDFDLERRSWRIPMTKTGRARHVPLADGVLLLLRSVPRSPSCPWAFANPKTGKPYNNIFGAWNTARTKAGLADVRIHDLRHSYASFLVNAGRTLYEVQHLLGHTQVKTTQRYAHLSQDTLLAAANAATKALDGYMVPAVDTPRLAA